MPAHPHDGPPLPGRAVVGQVWSDLVFLHWRADPERVAPMMPAGVRPDVVDGATWVGLIGFTLADHRFLPLPAVPVWGTFVEINVRLYSIDAAGRRGVVFRSLDASRLVSVLAARALFGLPYVWSRTRLQRSESAWEFTATRHWSGARTAFRVAATEEPDDSPEARWLTSRWGFHDSRRGRTIYARNTHPAWQPLRGRLLHLEDSFVAAAGFPGLADRRPDSVLVAPAPMPTLFSRPTTMRRTDDGGVASLER
ncbi:YqjF family protein [Microbacterium sp. NPDC078428]|uniref:YqjF family protein n=1 Tax=Microbacterium sp. NPDC078428 TaxID=3364190 RepID=UPI0037CA6670